jgi:DNA-binding beta-propeller fold protein YncE
MVVMDADNGHVITTLPTGSGTDGAAFDADTGLAFSSNGEGTLTVVHEDAADKFSVLENVPTQRGARTIALDEKTHKIYLPTAQFGPPPAPTPERPRPRPSILPGTFVVLVVERTAH